MPTTNYIAVARVAAGSSWARGASKTAALAALKKRVRSDWSQHYDLPTKIEVAIIDGTGIKEVYWDYAGYWDGDTDERIAAERIEQTSITL